MCPLYPLHLVMSYGLLVLALWMCMGSSLLAVADKLAPTLSASFHLNETAINSLNLTERETHEVTFYLDDLPPHVVGDIVIQESSDDGLKHIDITPDKVPLEPLSDKKIEGKFNVSGTLLGFSKIKLIVSNGNDEELMQTQPTKVVIHRGKRVLDKIFIHVVILLVVITYINMGCAIDLSLIKECLMRPIGPAIGLVCQYLFMPLAAYGLGYALFPSSPQLWLGLFVTGCAPGGGGSNMWTYMLDGNLDLSITMTLISTLVAFGTLPLWIYLLGKSIFEEGYYSQLPFRNIAVLVLGLVVPCGIGLLIKRFFPKAANFLKLMLKPLAAFFIIFVMTFGVYANLYMFSFFSWQVIVAGFCLPFLGFVFGAVVSVVSRRKWEDIIAISVETGIQNTGLAIGVIKIALRDFSPVDDISMVLPVAVATMTPIPLAIAYIWKRIRECRGLSGNKHLNQGDFIERIAGDGSDVSALSYHSEKDSFSSDKAFLQ